MIGKKFQSVFPSIRKCTWKHIVAGSWSQLKNMLLKFRQIGVIPKGSGLKKHPSNQIETA